MKDGQYRLLWTGISDSKKMKAISGPRWFRIGCHLVYTWLLPWCDDDGRMPGEPLKILANIVPNEGFTLKEIKQMIVELDRVGLIRSYIYSEELFISVQDWDKYQRIRKDRYKTSIYPVPPDWKPNDNQMTTNGQQNCDLYSSPSPSPSPSHTHQGDGFTVFYNAYPKHKSRGDAEKVWNKIKPDKNLIQKILDTIIKFKNSEEWTKENGKYIPYPATWLNAKGWEDEFDIQQPGKDEYENVTGIGGKYGHTN